jgi:TRAP-type transport system periplasmic protein
LPLAGILPIIGSNIRPREVSSMRKLLALAALLVVPVHAQDVTQWRLAHYLPEDHFFAAEWLPAWTRSLEQASEGRLRIQIIPNNQLLRLGAIAPGVRDGTAELGFGPAPQSAHLAVLGLPFMVDSAAHGTEVAMALLARGDLAAAVDGLHVAFLQTNAPSLVHTRGKPVRTPAELAGLRMRGATPEIRNLLAALGSTPVEGFLAPQVYGALRDGHVDGTVFPWEAMRVFDLGEQLDYHTEVYLFVATLGLFVNAEALAALPADLRAIVLAHSGLQTARSAAAAWDAEELRGRERALQLGNQIVRPTAAELAAWREAAGGFTRARLEAIGHATVDPQALHTDIRSLADAL